MDLEVRVTTLADAEVSHDTWFLGVVDQAALGGEDEGNTAMEAGSVGMGAIFHEMGRAVGRIGR